ncbi:MAG: phosphotransferase [Oscillospiraceae bacterium]|nr:phosphotransferase [Oscillospiraceae bacterium]
MVSDILLSFAAENYGFDKSTLRFISGSTNQIYSFQINGKGYILRFSERPAEQMRQTKAEMDWLYYLAKNDINVSLPLAAGNNQLVISTEADGKTYIISAFETLAGRFWDKNDPALWSAEIFHNWGKVMGDIHRLTKAYSPAGENDVRGAFTGYEALHIENIKHCATVYKITEDLLTEIMALPKDADSYGLIHYDLHPWNFIIDGKHINVFDFDDSLYGWFALDIGIALYHGLWWGRNNDAGQDFTNEIVDNFMNGYLSANRLADFWFDKIPLFMKFRQICKFSWFYNPSDIDEHQRERIKNIENGILFTGCEPFQIIVPQQ